MIYLASPYTHESPAMVQHRVEVTARVTAHLIMRGLTVFSPIIHCHGIAVEHELPGDAEYWHKFNTAFLRKADEMFVLMLPGWSSSVGVNQEIALAKQLYIPITGYNSNALAQFDQEF